MVNIENITRREEERKLKIKRTKELLNKFFDDICISNKNLFVTVTKNKQSNPFLFIEPSTPELDKMILTIPDSLIPKYTEKTIAFAKEYEKRFNMDVTLQTDYSK